MKYNQPILESQITEAIKEIRSLISEGWGMQYATKKACGSTRNNLAKAVRLTPEYLQILNKYMTKLDNTFQYEIKDGKLSPIKGRYVAR